MLTFDNYVMASSVEEAYELNKSRRNKVMGGNLWLKMGSKDFGTAIDLSSLSMDKITETEDGIEIGCMVTLREIETSSILEKAFGDVFRQALKHIVGVQFRNTATAGGSIYPRFGFSDVLTAFAALDTYVILHSGGKVPLKEFIEKGADNDILTAIYVKKDGRKAAYRSQRLTETDFAVLNCSLSCADGKYTAVFGARPQRAFIVDDVEFENEDQFVKEVTDKVHFGSNMRGSAKYRKAIAPVLLRRALIDIQEGEGDR